MIWGEILANVLILVVGYLWIDGIFGDKPTYATVFYLIRLSVN